MVVERRRELLELIQANGRVLAAEAAKRFGVSEDSIRRDLRALASEGLVQRVRGGALPAAASTAFVDRVQSPSPGSGALAKAVANRLTDIGGLIVLDAGSTSLRVAEKLNDTALTVVTASPAIGAAASGNGLRVIMLGGVVDPNVGAAYDTIAVDALRSIRADASLLGACAIDAVAGVTTNDALEVAFKRAVVAAGAETIVAAAADKLGTTGPFGVAALSEVTSVFTEAESADAMVETFIAAGVEVVRG